MDDQIAITRPAGTADLINRTIMEALADAWSRFPSEVALQGHGRTDQKLFGQVLSLLAQEGVVRTTDNSVALTESGYAAVEQASRTDHRVSEFLRSGSLPTEETGSSSLVLAVLRANFERWEKPNG